MATITKTTVEVDLSDIETRDLLSELGRRRVLRGPVRSALDDDDVEIDGDAITEAQSCLMRGDIAEALLWTGRAIPELADLSWHYERAHGAGA